MSLDQNQIIFINEYPNLYGGTEHYVYQVSQNLRMRGFETILLYCAKNFPDEKMVNAFDQLYPIIDLKNQLNSFPSGIVYLNNFRDPSLVRELQDVKQPVFRFIHDHYLTCPRSSKTNPITNETCRKTVGINCYTCPGVISRPDGKIKFRSPRETIRELLQHNNFKNIIVSSKYLQNEMIRNGIASKRISINPIYRSDLDQKYSPDLKRNKNQILFVGSLIKGKGVDLLIKAMAKSQNSFKLKIAGDGPWRKKLENLAKSTPSKSEIEFLGKVNQTELGLYYQESKAVIVPSTLPETFSKAGADGLHFGTLPICADVGGISSWCKHGINGYLIKSGDVNQLRVALDKLYNGDLDEIIDRISYIPSSLPTINDHVNRLTNIFSLELNRKTAPSKYSLSENENFIRLMDETCHLFKEVIIKHIGREMVDSIILIGGYGRGEGGVISREDNLHPHNNLDFQIILNTVSTKDAVKKRNSILKDIEEISSDKMITLDFSFNSKYKIKFGTPQLVYYDMKFGHRLIYGDDKWLLNIKKYNSQSISLHDIRELMINRGALLILNKKILQTKYLNKKMKMVIVKHLVKAVIGYGDALLYIHGKYHWSYKRKKELMWAIAPEYSSFARMYQYAINFRFNPDYSGLMSKDLNLIQRFVTRGVEKVHLKFESEISGKKNFEWNTYFNLITKKPLYSQKMNLINIFKIINNNFILRKSNFSKFLSGTKEFQCRLIGDKGILMALFPFVLYDAPLPNSLNKDIQDPLDFYIDLWGQTNDENFAQSLPGQIISEKNQKGAA